MSDYAMVSPYDAEKFERREIPWMVRLEYIGPNDSNKSGVSKKFWEIKSDCSGTVDINWGAIGTAGRAVPVTKSAQGGIQTMWKKFKDGYSETKPEQPRKLNRPDPEPKNPRTLNDLPAPFCRIDRFEYVGVDRYRAVDSNGDLISVMDAPNTKLIFDLSALVASRSDDRIKTEIKLLA